MGCVILIWLVPASVRANDGNANHCLVMARMHQVNGLRLLDFPLMYNLVRLVMLRSAELQRPPVEQIRSIDALRWLSSASWLKPLVELDFDLARDFEQAAVDRSELLADSSDEFQCHIWLRSLR